MKAYKIIFKTDIVYGSMIWNFLYGYEIWHYIKNVTCQVNGREIDWKLWLFYDQEFDKIDAVLQAVKPIIRDLAVKLVHSFQVDDVNAYLSATDAAYRARDIAGNVVLEDDEQGNEVYESFEDQLAKDAADDEKAFELLDQMLNEELTEDEIEGEIEGDIEEF